MFSGSGNKKYIEFLGLGAELAVALSAPVLAGYWLDQRWETSPWMLLAGIVTGLLIMTGIFSRVIKKVTSGMGDK